MFELELFLPCEEIFNSDWSECSELWSFEDFFDFFFDFEVSFIGSALDKKINNPQSDLLDNIIDDGFISILIDNIFDKFGDLIEIISGDTSHGFDLVLDGCFGIGFSVLEMDIELILMLVFG